MSENTAEAPVQEQQASTSDYVSLLSGLKVIRPGETAEKPPEQAAQEFKPTEEKPPEEQKPEIPDGEIDPEKPPSQQIKVGATREPKSEKAQENFKTLQESRNQERKAREEAESRLKEWEQKYGARDREFQELQERLRKASEQPQIPENFQQEFQRQQQLIQELQTNLRAASIERDPEFVAKYQTGRQQQITRLQELAGMVGVSAEDFQRAVKYNDEEKLSDIKDSLPAGQKFQWDAIRTRIAALDIEREEAVQNSSKTWEQLQKAREEQFHQQKQQHVQAMRAIANKVRENYWNQIPILKENPQLAQQVEATLEAVVDKMDTEQIIGRAALVDIYYHRDQEREKILNGLLEENKQIAELKKQLEERDKFIKSRYGGTGESYSGAKPTYDGDLDPNLPPSQQIRVRTS